MKKMGFSIPSVDYQKFSDKFGDINTQLRSTDHLIHSKKRKIVLREVLHQINMYNVIARMELDAGWFKDLLFYLPKDKKRVMCTTCECFVQFYSFNFHQLSSQVRPGSWKVTWSTWLSSPPK